MGRKEETLMNHSRNEIVNAIKLRIKRDSLKYKDDENRISHYLIENATGEQFEQLLHIMSPLVGLKSSFFRRAAITLMCRIKKAKAYEAFTRAFLVEANNTYNLSRKTKDILVSMLLKGTVTDEARLGADWSDEERKKKSQYWPGNYHRAWILARERFYQNKKINSPKVNYTMILEHFKDWQGGDVFDDIENDKDLDAKSKEYTKYVKQYAITRLKYISSIHNAQLNESCNLGNINLAVNGSLSKYRNKNINDEDFYESVKNTYEQQIAQLIFDIAILIRADSYECEELFTKYNESKY